MAFAYTFDEIKDRPVAVIGAGTLGRRISMMMASQGGQVNIYDPNQESADQACQFVQEQVPGVVKDRGFGSVGTPKAFSDEEKALENVWLVIEAVPEVLDLKKKVWATIDSIAPKDAIFATNSSSFPSRLIASSIENKERFMNAHFYMPPIANGMDLMSDGETSDDALNSLKEIFPKFGVYPFIAHKESTGFIFNRIWAAIKRESLEVVYEGVSTPSDVDEMMELNMGVPTGPFKNMDMVGLDVVLDIEENYASQNPNLPEGPRILLKKYVDAGKLGVKTGEGFYKYK